MMSGPRPTVCYGALDRPGRRDFSDFNFHPALIKNYRRRDRNHLGPPVGSMQQSPAVECAILSAGRSGGIRQ